MITPRPLAADDAVDKSMHDAIRSSPILLLWLVFSLSLSFLLVSFFLKKIKRRDCRLLSVVRKKSVE